MTRGMTPGSARAWSRNETVTGEASPSLSAAAPSGMEDDIAKILGGLAVNQHGPSPSGARGGNSPLAGAMCKPDHIGNVGLCSAAVKPMRRAHRPPSPLLPALSPRVEAL